MFWFALAATAISAYGSMAAGKAAANQAAAQGDAASYQGIYNREMRDLEAKQVREQATKQAEGIRRKAIAFRSTQAVTQAASGVLIGEGSAQAVIDKTTELASADVLATLYSGVNKAISIKQSGRNSYQSGKNTSAAYFAKGQDSINAGRINAASSMLSFAGNNYSYFKTGKDT